LAADGDGFVPGVVVVVDAGTVHQRLNGYALASLWGRGEHARRLSHFDAAPTIDDNK
jgi:hypothetical protein